MRPTRFAATLAFALAPTIATAQPTAPGGPECPGGYELITQRYGDCFACQNDSCEVVPWGQGMSTACQVWRCMADHDILNCQSGGEGGEWCNSFAALNVTPAGTVLATRTQVSREGRTLSVCGGFIVDRQAARATATTRPPAGRPDVVSALARPAPLVLRI